MEADFHFLQPYAQPTNWSLVRGPTEKQWDKAQGCISSGKNVKNPAYSILKTRSRKLQ